MTTVGLIGTLDTKHDEYLWLRDQLIGHGVSVLLIDVGAFSASELADVSSAEVAAAGGGNLATLQAGRDRGETMSVMAAGVAVVAARLFQAGDLQGLFAVGGSGGSSVAAAAMQALPVGVPKLLVSTMASGDVHPYIGEVDTTLMYSVVDVAGINSISRQVLGNAAAGIAAMAQHYAAGLANPSTDHRPLVAVTMFGVTTPAADEARARARLTELGYEALVFHATGAGGRAMEKLVESGFLVGVCDLTTTELADDLVGGVLSAGPHRLETAGRRGVPQVVSLGALDMVNFGPRETVPARFADRNLFVHNPTVTLMRTTEAEMTELGRRIAVKLAAATAPTEVFIPRRGVSAIDVAGAPFRDAAADEACFTALRKGLAGSDVVIHELDQAINDPGFGAATADALHRLIQSNPKEI